MIKSIYCSFLLILLSALLLMDALAGADRSSARLVGLARANTSVARGLESLGSNPALLSIPHRSKIEISILPLGARFGSNFLTYKLYSDYLTGVDDPVTGDRVAKHLSPSDKQKILDSFPNGIGSIYTDINIMWLGLSIHTQSFGGLAVSVTDRFSANFALPNDYVRMILEGFPEYGASYDFSKTEIRSSWIREYALGYATPRLGLLSILPWVSFGVSVKHIEGYSYFGAKSVEGTLTSGGVNERFRISGEFNMVSQRAAADFLNNSGQHGFNPLGNPAGKGLGFDAGFAAGISDKIVIGLSVTDIGSIRWTENTYGSMAATIVEMDDILSKEQQDSLLNAYTGKEEAIAPFSTTLPTAIRAGVSLNVFPRLILAADFRQGIQPMPGKVSSSRMAFGGEWRPLGFLPVRSGIAFGGYDGFTWAFGFGVNIFVFDLEIATENIGLLIYPEKSKQASITIGTKFRL